MSRFNILNGTGVALDPGAADVTAHTSLVEPVKLPEQAAPDLNGFLSGHGIGSGSDGSFGGTDGIDLSGLGHGSDDNQGSGLHLPGFGGGGGDVGVPSGISFGDGSMSGSLGVPSGIDFGDGSISGSLGVPGGLDVGNGDISGSLGVPGDIGNNGGISGPGVPNSSGSIGVGGFTPDDFQNGHLADAPDDVGAKGSGHSYWDAVSSSLSHGDVFGAAWNTASALVNEGLDNVGTAKQNGDVGGVASGSLEAAVGGALAAVTAAAYVGSGPAVGTLSNTVGVVVNAVTPDEAPQTKDDTPPPPKPDDPNKGNQPVDDSGTGPAHPTTHNNEQPVDDSGIGPVHPMTSVTAQPVNDSDTSPSHPGTHLGAIGLDAANINSTGLVASSADDGGSGGNGSDVGHLLGGHAGAFWSVAADGPHASVAANNFPMADAGVAVAHNDALGIFERLASASRDLAPSAAHLDTHAHLDELATTHVVSAHVEADAPHSFEAGLDLGHLALHM